MKKMVIAALLAGCASLNVNAGDPATVNGKPIKQSMVDYILKAASAQGRQVDDKARAIIIDKLITTEVIDQEAQKSDIVRQPEFLMNEEMTRRDLRINAYIEDYLKKNPIDDQALQSEYAKFKAQTSGKEYKASHILVQTEEEAKDLISKLANGADFVQLAKEKSLDSSKENGGDLGWFQSESMVRPFSDAVANLRKGSYTTAPVKTEFGWHVIRLDDIRDVAPPPFDTVKNELRSSLQQQQLETLINGLRAKATIVNNAAPK